MAVPPIGTQEPRGLWPKAPHRSGSAEPEGHEVFVGRWKEYRVRNVRFSHFLLDLYGVNCLCKNSMFSPLGWWLALECEPLSFLAQGMSSIFIKVRRTLGCNSFVPRLQGCRKEVIDTASACVSRISVSETNKCFRYNCRPFSQAGRRRFEPGLPLHRINNLQKNDMKIIPINEV
jgi:hypothetical protein